jgi:TonB family protein
MQESGQYQLTFVVDRKPKWSAVTVSFVVQAAALVLLVEIGIFLPRQLVEVTRHYEAINLALDTPTAHPIPEQKVLKTPPPPRPELDRYFDQAALRVPARMRVAPEAPKVEAPKLELPKRANIDLPPAPVVKPAPIVQTGMFAENAAKPTVNNAPRNLQTAGFSSGSSAKPTLKGVQAKDVQTGGFGDPNGIRGIGKGEGKLVAAAVGSFDLPGGAGNGNGTGGTRGRKGTIASAGFGNGVATSNPGNVSGGGMARSTIQQGGFGDSRAAEHARVAKASAAPVVAPTLPVQIISKPTPVYTEEARALRLEGDVVLEVLFSAAGQARVSRVVRGLGHGLDESAARAVAQIRYRPAKRDGRDVDSTSVIHVVFQLAY